MKHAANHQAYALGEQRRNGFYVRRVVWGKLLATMERRSFEEIRKATLMVSEKKSKPYVKPTWLSKL
jgi:hypothetical protein